MVHPIFENFDCKMVVVPSRLWLPLFSPCLSRTAGWGASLQHCVQGPCASTAPESRGWKSGSHSQDCTATILLWKFSKMWRCLGYKIWENTGGRSTTRSIAPRTENTREVGDKQEAQDGQKKLILRVMHNKKPTTACVWRTVHSATVSSF